MNRIQTPFPRPGWKKLKIFEIRTETSMILNIESISDELRILLWNSE